MAKLGKPNAEDDQRILVLIHKATHEELRKLSFDSRVAIAEIVRQCISAGLDTVRKSLKKT